MNKTKFAYDRASHEYERKFSNNIEYIKQVSFFSDLFSEGSSILDIGCGPGLNAKIFSRKELHVTGFDISPEMVKLAKRNCPNGTFFVSSVNKFTTDFKFDGICLSFIIVHLKTDDVVSLLNKLPLFVKKTGKIYISFMAGKKPGYETTSFSKNKIYFNYFQKGFIVSCFEKNGFNLIYSSTAPYEENDGSVTEDIFLIFG